MVTIVDLILDLALSVTDKDNTRGHLTSMHLQPDPLQKLNNGIKTSLVLTKKIPNMSNLEGFKAYLSQSSTGNFLSFCPRFDLSKSIDIKMPLKKEHYEIIGADEKIDIDVLYSKVSGLFLLIKSAHSIKGVEGMFNIDFDGWLYPIQNIN